MKPLTFLRTLTEAVAAALMALMFLTFILQIAVRYSARIEGIAARFPLFDPSLYGWTLELCLLLWVWLVFWGNAFVVRDRDHVTFDMLYLAVNPKIQRWFAVIGGLAICIGLLASIGPTMEKFHILRLKKTATLSNLLGDWIRMRDIYSIYILFLFVVGARYAYAVWRAFRYGVEEPEHLQ